MKYPSSTSKPPVRRKSGIIVRDALFVLFTLLCLGGAAAMIYKATLSPSYETQAKLLVRYVLERSAVDPYESMVDASGARGIDVMDAEIEIIKSADLALEVATKIGPEKILPKSNIPPTKADAAMQIAKNLDVQTTRGSSVIHLAYHHPDPTVAVDVLKQLIDTYFEKHLTIHRSTGAFESVQRQTDQARSRLSQTETDLSKLSSESGFMSLADAKTALEFLRSVIRLSLMDSQVQLAEQQVKVASLEASMGVKPLAPPKADDKAADEAKPVEETPAERMERVKAQDQYRDLAHQLRMFKEMRDQLMMTHKPGDRMIVALDGHIASIQKQGLAGQAKVQGTPSPQTPGGDLNAERATLEALQAKCKALTEQVAQVDADVQKISSGSLEFANLERRRQLEEEKYRYFETSLEKARVDETLNPASMPNIGVVQNPSTPVRSLDDTTKKIAMGLAACGLLLLLRIAFGIMRRGFNFTLPKKLS